MKKGYLKPEIEQMSADLTILICGSQDIYSDKGIDYGGVDEEGTMDPASRRYNIWEEEENE